MKNHLLLCVLAVRGPTQIDTTVDMDMNVGPVVL